MVGPLQLPAQAQANQIHIRSKTKVLATNYIIINQIATRF